MFIFLLSYFSNFVCLLLLHILLLSLFVIIVIIGELGLYLHLNYETRVMYRIIY